MRTSGVVGLDQFRAVMMRWQRPATRAARPLAEMPAEQRAANGAGLGRELFANMRRHARAAEEGACTWL